MSQSLLQTEMTDAVNTGIVDRADKSEKSLKSGLYSVGKKAATGGAASAALAAVTNGRKGGKGGSASNGASPKSRAGKAGAAVMAHNAVHGALEGSELEGADDLYNSGKGAYRAGRAIGRRISGKSASLDIKGAVKGAGKAAARGAVSNALQGSELEGVDNVYDGARTGYHVVKGVKKRLGGKNPLSSDKSLGKLSEKKSAKKAANTVEAKRKAQAAGYFKKNVYTSVHNAQKGKQAASAAKSSIHFLASGSKGGFLAAIGSPFILIGLLLIIILLSAILGGGANTEMEKNSIGTLTGVPAEVATYLKGYGYTNEAIAGILGNMSQENSGFDPGLGGDDGYGTDSIGLIQLSGTNKNYFLRWCANNGKVWSTVSAQMEWTFSGEQGTGYFVNDWETHLANAPSYYRYERGYEERFGNDFYRSGEEIKTSTDVDLVTYSFMACHERCGSKISYSDDVSRLYRRLDEAHKFLAQLNSGGTGGGADYENAEPWQKAIHDNALTTPSPGAGWCAMWVSQVYYNAGFGYIGGNADDMYYRYCHSSDRSELKVGMLIAVDKYVTNGYPYAGYSPDGRKLSYHVGIYMGNGMVRDNIGSIMDTPLDQWIATYGNYHEVRWGFGPH